MKKRIISISAILLIAVAITATLAKNKKVIDSKNQVIDRSEIPVPVSVIAASLLPVQGNISLPSVLAPYEEAEISAGSSGKITRLNIDLGSRVTKGQVIGEIDARQKRISLQNTELTVEKLKKDYQRSKDLLEGNAINETSVSDALYNYENNRLQAEQIRQQIEDAGIVSPISGIVISKNMLAGEYVNTGASIASVVDVSRLKAIVYVNEKDIYRLKQDQKAIVFSEIFAGKEFQGKISYISPKGDENHNYQVEVLIENTVSQLKAGTYVKVEFAFEKSESSLQVPKKALVEGIKNPYVYVISGNRASQRRLVLGKETGENIEVLEGLKEGEEIVLDGLINLIEGSVIEKIN
jgi:RND family efflux transporter MFP subunit